MCENPHQLWQCIALRNSTSRILSIIHDGTDYFDEANAIVNEFARTFANSYLTSCNKDHLADESLSYNLLGVPIITDDYILTSTQKLKPTSIACNNLILSFIIKHCGMVLLYPLKIFEFHIKWKFT